MTQTVQVKPDATADTAKPAAGASVTQTGNVTKVQTDPNAPPARPDYIPEKFWKGNVEESTKAMAQSYTELEKKQGGEPKKVDDLKTTPPAPDAAATAKAVTAAGLDFGKLEAEYNTNGGKLSAESYAALEKAGFPKDTVDKYVAGQEAVAKDIRTQFTAIAGDEQGLKDVIAWANTGLPKEQQDAYNKALESGDVNVALLAFRGVHAAYVAENGKPGTIQQGGTRAGGTAGIAAYESNAQVVKDMRSEEYRTDPAFRAKVQARLAVSPNVL